MTKSNELTQNKQSTVQEIVDTPSYFQYPNSQGYENINQGVVAVESNRAIAEAQGKLILAKRFPRDETVAYSKARQACQRKGMAENAFYSYPKGGSTVTGPSIRFAEELARCWGNIEYGIKELSRDKEKSEMQAIAWDMETNTVSVQNFTSPHRREVNGYMKTLTSDRDIYETNANMAARRLRARILAILPNYYVDDCILECKKTLAGKNDEPLEDRIRKMAVAFKALGVSKTMIENRLKRDISTMNVEDLIEFVGIYNSIKDKQSSVADWFEFDKKNESEIVDLLEKELKENKEVK